MTALERLNSISSYLYSLAFAINKYTKRGRDVPDDLLAQFGQAWEAKEAALAELNRMIGGRK